MVIIIYQNLYLAEIGIRIFKIWLSFSLLCRSENEPTLNLSNGIALVVNCQHYMRWRGRAAPSLSMFYSPILSVNVAAIENGLTCHRLDVRYCQKSESKTFKLFVLKTIIIHGSLNIFWWTWGYVLSPLYALFSSVNETKRTLLNQSHWDMKREKWIFKRLLEFLAREILWIQRNSLCIIVCASAFCIDLEIISLPTSTFCRLQKKENPWRGWCTVWSTQSPLPRGPVLPNSHRIQSEHEL